MVADRQAGNRRAGRGAAVLVARATLHVGPRGDKAQRADCALRGRAGQAPDRDLAGRAVVAAILEPSARVSTRRRDPARM
jgi:hypothetical protein